MTSLPEPVPNTTKKRRTNWRSESMSAVNKCKSYLERLLRVDHMDFEFASWQMIYLFISPSKVFKHSTYRKQAKNQFARDDPAFLVLLGMWFIVSATGLSVVLRLPFASFLKFIFWIVFVDFFGAGIVVATIFWLISNRYMRKGSTADDVEWGFAFDVHLNAFFPPLLIIHVFQLLFFNRKCHKLSFADQVS